MIERRKFVDNYCRHTGNGVQVIGTGQTLFFADTPPMPEHEYKQWAFWRVPDGMRADKFTGKLIGESDNMRGIRLVPGLPS
jgi:hypothetical protein